MGVKSFLVGSVPYIAMVVMEFFLVGIVTFCKAAMNQGASPYILLLYSNAAATLFLLPPFFLNMKTRPKMTFDFLWKVFILSLVGMTLMQNCTLIGVSYGSPTLATAISNLIPAFTFLLAVIFRMEKLDLRSLITQIKIIGTLVSVAGAFIITLYQGPPIAAVLTQHQPQPSTLYSLLATTSNWVIGGIILPIGYLSSAVGNIFQAAILKSYPSELTLVTFYCFFGTIQTAIVALIAERNPDSWKIKTYFELFTVVFMVLGDVLIFGALAWCVKRRGPVFVAMFNPVGILIVALFSDIFLGDTLHVGSVIGTIVILAGFYGVIWAQSKEEENSPVRKTDKPELSEQETPLLEDNDHVQV